MILRDEDLFSKNYKTLGTPNYFHIGIERFLTQFFQIVFD